ncbi:DUF4142 domain-containing protein [Parapedobacter lycopersici]|uniref:DUF4142 domain-containing protein n=1 Tax=Parapedobacter lycopersici TaxID=1864939 RepID=UPI00214D60EE|nr:DUF4142 domain-containing protein [Parapedobacter lycopersici]
MKTLTQLSLGIFLTCSMLACNNNNGRTADDSVEQAQDVNDTTATVKMEDSEFAVKAADASLAEVQLGKLALERTTDQRIKDYAQLMIDDHNKANDELMTIAANKNITLPPVPSEDHAANMRDLQQKSGTDFDQAYLDRMVRDHNNAVSLFEDASKGTADPDLKNFAAKALPTLQMHHEKAKELRDSLDTGENVPALTPDTKIVP